jgi:hypothetical protein
MGYNFGGKLEILDFGFLLREFLDLGKITTKVEKSLRDRKPSGNSEWN